MSLAKYIDLKEGSGKKKLTAIFYNKDKKRIKTIGFGSKGMKDFTLHSPSDRDERKRLYIIRHKKRENWNNPMSAGALSKHILWNKTSRSESIKSYMNKFNLTRL